MIYACLEGIDMLIRNRPPAPDEPATKIFQVIPDGAPEVPPELELDLENANPLWRLCWAPDTPDEFKSRVVNDGNVNWKLFDNLAWLFFLDMRKCFDRICRDILYFELTRLGVEFELVSILVDFYSKTKLRTKTNGLLSRKEVEMILGLPQGDSSSPAGWIAIFDHVIDGLVRCGAIYKIETDHYLILCFADDTLWICKDPIRLQYAMDVCKVLIDRIDMVANTKKSAVMIIGSKRIRKQFRKYLVFKRGDKIVPIVSDYKYLGVLLNEELLKRSSWKTQETRIAKKAGFVYHKCARFVNSSSTPLPYRIQNFRTMIIPQYTYSIEIWTSCNDDVAKLSKLFARQVAMTIRCNIYNANILSCLLAGIRPLEWWAEYYRLQFKYRQLVKDVEGPHNWVRGNENQSVTNFSMWSKQEQHGSWFSQVGGFALDRNTECCREILDKCMKKWYVDFVRETAQNNSKYDPDVVSICCDSKLFELSKEERSKIFEWISSEDFSMLVDILGCGNNFLDNNMICPMCGVGRRSWIHNCVECPKSTIRVDLVKLLESKENCTTEMNKLKKLLKYFCTKKMMPDIIKKRVNVYYLNRSEGQYRSKFMRLYITKQLSNHDYRCFDIEDSTLHFLDLRSMYAKGFLYVLSDEAQLDFHNNYNVDEQVGRVHAVS